MAFNRLRFSLCLAILSASVVSPAGAQVNAKSVNFEYGGSYEIELSAFTSEGQFVAQDYRYNTSLALEPELYWDWNGGDSSVRFTPFARFDQNDSERSHFDIRELLWTGVTGDWEFRAGLGKIFWGVTEFNHLVDIINQSDSVDAFDGEQKLGQPMLAASKVTNSGIYTGYILPGFRERTFAGENGRFRSALVVDTDNASYESDQESRHIDIALRWSHSIDVYDLGAYVFRGTDRSPTFSLATNSNGDNVLQPYYQQITQLGFDAQATIDSWLLKLETVINKNNTENFVALQGGFEYSFYGVGGSIADLGVLVEYGWDERGKKAANIGQNDIYFGTRLVLNNTQDTAVLFGASVDNDYQTKTFLLEASQRLNDYWSASLDASIFIADDEADPAAAFDKDDRVQLTLERFF